MAYEALSYSWGDQTPDTTVQIDGKSFLVTPNLHAAIERLRSPRERRVLWVDAICVDQHSENEKDLQVPMMADIYGGAETVCIWLGHEENDSSKASNFIRREILNLSKFDRVVEQDTYHCEWAAIAALMKRPWFSRWWVVQEVVFAKKAVLYCGQEEIDWKDFADAVSLFVAVESQNSDLSRKIKANPQFNNVPGFFGSVQALGASILVEATSNLVRRSNDGKTEPILPLETLVSTLSMFRTTNLRDTIYALLSLARDTSPKTAAFTTVLDRMDDLHDAWARIPSPKSHLQSIPEQQTPNPSVLKALSIMESKVQTRTYPVQYQASWLQVCKDFIAHTIKQSGSLNILCRPWAPHKDHRTGKILEAPTWVNSLRNAPYGVKKDEQIGCKMTRKNADPLVGPPQKSDFNAAGDTKVQCWCFGDGINEDEQSLFVKGFVFDSVKERGDASQSGTIPSSWLDQGWPNRDELPPDDFWRLLVADRGPSGVNAPGFYQRFLKHASDHTVEDDHIVTQSMIDHGRNSFMCAFLRRIQAVIWGRRMIISGRGSYGLAVTSVKEGDLICILFGCNVPVILRSILKDKRERLSRVPGARKHHLNSASLDNIEPSRSRALSNSKRPRSDSLAVPEMDSKRTRLEVHDTSSDGDEETRKPWGEDWRHYYYEFIGECYLYGMMNGEAIDFRRAQLENHIDRKLHDCENQVFELR